MPTVALNSFYSNQKFLTVKPNTQLDDRSFVVAGPRLCNSLPAELC